MEWPRSLWKNLGTKLTYTQYFALWMRLGLELSLPIASFSGSGFGLGTSLLEPILEPKYFVGSLIPRLSPSKWNEAKCLKVCYGGLLTPPPGLSAVDSEQQSWWKFQGTVLVHTALVIDRKPFIYVPFYYNRVGIFSRRGCEIKSGSDQLHPLLENYSLPTQDLNPFFLLSTDLIVSNLLYKLNTKHICVSGAKNYDTKCSCGVIPTTQQLSVMQVFKFSTKIQLCEFAGRLCSCLVVCERAYLSHQGVWHLHFCIYAKFRKLSPRKRSIA